MSARPNNKQDQILDAAARVVERQGAAHLTIDAVAAEAGLSKGGVLYHFPSKHALLSGMLERVLNDFKGRTASHEGREVSPVCAWIKAEYHQSPTERAMGLAVLANAAEDPSLLDPARSFIQESFDNLRQEGTDGELNLILMLAAEGKRFLDMLGLFPLEGKDLDVLHARMLELGEAAGQ